NRVQHALRAYTPAEQKGLRAAAQSFRTNPAFDTAEAIQALGVGEALVSTLDEKGAPPWWPGPRSVRPTRAWGRRPTLNAPRPWPPARCAASMTRRSTASRPKRCCRPAAPRPTVSKLKRPPPPPRPRRRNRPRVRRRRRALRPRPVPARRPTGRP